LRLYLETLFRYDGRAMISDSDFDHVERINRVVDRIQKEPGHPFTLEELSSIACFSGFHFHRIFCAVTGETPAGFIRRERIKKCLALLMHNHGISLTDIALESGFSSSANFSKALKKILGLSPRQIRNTPYPELMERLGRKRRFPDFKDPRWDEKLRAVTFRNMPSADILYIRHRGRYDWTLGIKWIRFTLLLRAHNLLGPATVLMGIPRDNPDLTDPDTAIYDMAATGIEPGRKIPPLLKSRLDPGLCAVFPFTGTSEELEAFISVIYGKWMVENRREPDTRPILQIIKAPPRGPVLDMELVIPVLGNPRQPAS
jgi:AraC family transcriptional regulator